MSGDGTHPSAACCSPPEKPPSLSRAAVQVGTCNALSGLCTCPGGWTGFNCLHPMKRYCAQQYRTHGFEPHRQEPNLTVGLEWESIFSFPRTHCAGGGAAAPAHPLARKPTCLPAHLACRGFGWHSFSARIAAVCLPLLPPRIVRLLRRRHRGLLLPL